MQLKIISAGAGSGKTYRLTGEMVALLQQGVRAQGIIATTFTQKAAAELQERVRVRLLESGLTQQAEDLTNALIGTVHGLGVKLLRRFSYEAGVSPEVSIIAEEDQQILFNQSLSMVLNEERVERMQVLCDRLGVVGDWREEVRKLTEVARSNNFSASVLVSSRDWSYTSFEAFLGPVNPKFAADMPDVLARLLEDTIYRLRNNGDTTKVTEEAVSKLEMLGRDLRLKKRLNWPQWAELYKIQPGAKSKSDMEALKAFAASHVQDPAFRQDIQDYIYEIFNLAVAAIEEYQQYKQKRGLIDYTDMEAQVNLLLDNPSVREVLSEEIDLLLVDEFQDTSPLQLELFLKLSRLARHSIWVGDPKQSIYGFRGAAPELMQAIIDKTGGIKPGDIQKFSWRSRADLVYAANAVFTKAFTKMPSEQVALEAKRLGELDPVEMEHPLQLWKFDFEQAEDDPNKRAPGRPWLERCIAHTLSEVLAGKIYVLPKGETQARPARPGDVAILCRSNDDCNTMTEALHHAGMQVSIARAGLMQRPEIRLVLACLKYLLHHQDSLSVAEILLLAENIPVEEIIENRFTYLDHYESRAVSGRWAQHYQIIADLDRLRQRMLELSSSETLDMLLGELELRRIVASWGSTSQRLDNIELLRRLVLEYEEACNRLQTAASLGGFLLWINRLESSAKDFQSSGESAQAVNVLTYHKSKGLEWPIVICYNLDNDLRLNIWGIDIVPDSPDVDLNDLLGKRKVRYWVNPYGTQVAKTPLFEAIMASTEYARKRQQALEEESRLLYVGMTRARDYLVCPLGHKSVTKWLNRVWYAGQEEHPTLDPDQPESPWEWNNRLLPMQVLRKGYPRRLESRVVEEEAVDFIDLPIGKREYPALYIDPRREKAPSGVKYTVGDLIRYGTNQGVSLAESETIRAFLVAFYPDFTPAEQEALAHRVLDQSVQGVSWNADALIPFGTSWHHFLSSHFRATEHFRQYSLRCVYKDRVLELTIDELLDTDAGWVAIQYVYHADEGITMQTKVQEFFSWSAWVTYGLQAVHTPRPVRTYIHFLGAQIGVEISQD